MGSIAENKEILTNNTSQSFFAGGGRMGEMMRLTDWSATPLGPVSGWPQSLRSALGICLGSAFPIGIYWGKELILLYNDAWSPIPGNKHPWALGKPAIEVWPEIWNDIEPLFNKVFQTGEASRSIDALLPMQRHGYTEECYFDFTFTPIRDENGNVTGIFNAVIETTYRVINERRATILRNLSEKLNQAKSVPEIFTIAGPLLNEAVKDIPFSLVYLNSEDGQQADRVLAAGLAPAAPASFDLKKKDTAWPFTDIIDRNSPVHMPDNSLLFGKEAITSYWPEPSVECLIIPIGLNKVTGFFVAGINPRRALDGDYRGFLHSVVSHFSNTIFNVRSFEEERKKAEALQEIDRAKTLFFSNVSHEFRTPLTLMLGPLQEMLNENRDDNSREHLDVIYRNGLRLKKLVNTLLDFSRFEAGRMKANYVPTDIAGFTAELASNFRSAVEKAGMELKVNTSKLSEKIYIDRDMWEKIIFNLLSNAFKFTFEGEIEVVINEDDRYASLIIRDTGEGIPAADLPFIFDRFKRVEGARSRTFEGSGIGLSLVQDLVKLHGGNIQVESTIGKGTIFKIRIPKGNDHLPAEQIQSAVTQSTAIDAKAYVGEAEQWLPDVLNEKQGEAVTGITALSAKPVVLLADDNADMRSYVQRLLKERFEVIPTTNGKEALRVAKTKFPDLVLADIMMPEMNGLELLKELKADPATFQIPFIIISAQAGEEARLGGIGAGADDYLVKPFSANELIARVSTSIATHSNKKKYEETLRESNSKLKESEEKLRALADNIPNLCWMANADGWIYWYNSRWYEYTGTTIEEMKGWGWQSVHDPEMLSSVMEKWKYSLATGKPFEMVFPLKGADGIFRPFLTRVVPVKDDKGNIWQWFGTNTDITERENFAKQKDEFMGIASHELKTPVTSIKASIQIINRLFAEKSYDKAGNFLVKAEINIDKLTGLINDLLDISRIQGGKLRYNLSAFDITDILRDVVEEIQQQSKSHRIIIQGTASVVVYGDKVRLEQVITNLLTNAIKYSPDAKEVIIDIEKDKNMLKVSVTDFGVGIPKDMQAHVFDRFFRVEKTSHRFQGLGLGLYICHEIIKRHSGSIGLVSEEGKGSTFWFSIPLPESGGK